MPSEDKPRKSTSKKTAEKTTDVHMISIEELESRFDVKIEKGLSSEEHAIRIEKYGYNELAPRLQKPGWMKFLEHLFSGFAMLLWIAAILSIGGYMLQPINQENLYLGVVLIIVVVVTAVFSFVQDSKSSSTMAGFSSMVPKKTTVLRDGQQTETEVRNLVVGDIVMFKSGDVVPADIRVLECSGLKVDNSSLTGESEAQSRSAEGTDTNHLETKNLCFFSTNVVSGNAKGMVVMTGADTTIGEIAALATDSSAVKTPIAIEIEHFIHIISGFAIVLGIIFFAVGLFVYDFISNVVFTIGIIVANVPEGLLATVTVALTLTAKRMAAKNVLVKNLESVETLGSTTCICSDKTGTLTQNRMTCVHLWHDDGLFTPKTSHTDQDFNESSPACQAHLRCMALNNISEFFGGDDHLPMLQRKCSGDASEAALFKMVAGVSDVGDMRSSHPLVFELPFNSKNKFKITIHKVPGESRLLLLIKGAPERVMDRSATILVNGQEHPMEGHWRSQCEAANYDMGSKGERVFGFAQLWLDPAVYTESYPFDVDEWNFPVEGFCFIGLSGLIDPPRPAVPSAVKTCKRAGIKVFMVTGDHPTTAHAIAKQVGIITGGTKDEIAAERGCDPDSIPDDDISATVITGADLRDIDDAQLKHILENHQEIVFARTSPTQKLRIVEGCQAINEIVAVTGDGVNDSPALKKADIGIAMFSGSDVTKDVADMVLLDDNFASIVRGVEEGRLIFDNLKKSIAYTLSSNIPEITPFILFILLQIPLPLSTVLILCVDIGTDLIPAISLAYETAESDIMLRRPRNAKVDKLVTPRLISFAYLQIGIIQACAGMYTYFVVMGDFGFPPSSLIGTAALFDSKTGVERSVTVAGQTTNLAQRVNALGNAQTAYFVSIVVVQWADLLACKTRKLSLLQHGMKNMVLNFGLFSETILALIICYAPFLDIALGTRPLFVRHWFPALPFTLLILCYDELRKLWIRTWPNGWVTANTYY